jgi:hypothetical protein
MRPACRWGLTLALLAALTTVSLSTQAGAQQPKRPSITARDAALLVWTSDNDAGACGEECWGGYSLWTSAPQTSVFRRVLRQFSLTPPEISPDQRWIVYTDWTPSEEPYDADHIEIRVRPILRWRPIPKLGRARVVWTKTPLYALHMAWSPDSRSLAVLDNSRRRPTLTVVAVRTRVGRKLNTSCVPRSRDPNFGARAVDWSNHGTIGFVSGTKAGGRATYRVTADGNRACHVISATSEPIAIAWSPAGDRLLVSKSMAEENDVLITVRSDGLDPRILRQATADDPACDEISCGFEAPTWSPDGASVAYLTQNTNTVSLWPIGADGPHHGITLRRLSVRLGEGRSTPADLERVTWLPKLPS